MEKHCVLGPNQLVLGGGGGGGGGLTRKDNAFLGLINSFLVTIEPLHAMAAWQELLSLSLGCDKPNRLNRGLTVECLLINKYSERLKVRRGLHPSY